MNIFAKSHLRNRTKLTFKIMIYMGSGFYLSQVRKITIQPLLSGSKLPVPMKTCNPLKPCTRVPSNPASKQLLSATPGLDCP